jgi:hypothetical protein
MKMGSDDEITKPERAPIQRSMAELELEHLRKRILDVNDIMVVNELRNMLIGQQQQDIAINELQGLVRTLSAGVVATMDEVEILQRSVLSLTAGRDEMLKKQEAIAKMCDALAESIKGQTEP